MPIHFKVFPIYNKTFARRVLPASAHARLDQIFSNQCPSASVVLGRAFRRLVYARTMRGFARSIQCGQVRDYHANNIISNQFECGATRTKKKHNKTTKPSIILSVHRSEVLARRVCGGRPAGRVLYMRSLCNYMFDLVLSVCFFVWQIAVV